MTGITLIRGIDVRCRFAGGNHTVMTTLAGAHGFVVIDLGRRHPGRTGMAGLADIAGENMRRTLSRSNRAIVAGDTGIRSGAVIKGTDEPVSGSVANITGLSGRHMCHTLACSDNTIMTGLASTDDLRMIYRGGRCPGRRRVACIAQIRRGDMSSTTTGGNHTIVTGCTATGDFDMIHGSCRYPGGRHMAGNTVVTRGYVSR